MSELNRESVEAILAKITDPYLRQDLCAANAIKSVKIDKDKVEIDLVLGYPAEGYHGELITAVQGKLRADAGVAAANIHIKTNITIWHWHCGLKAPMWVSWMRIFMAPASRGCWGATANRTPWTARRLNRISVTGCNPCLSVI